MFFFYLKSWLYFVPLDNEPHLFYAILFSWNAKMIDKDIPFACPTHSSLQSVYFYNALNFMHFDEVLWIIGMLYM